MWCSPCNHLRCKLKSFGARACWSSKFLHRLFCRPDQARPGPMWPCPGRCGDTLGEADRCSTEGEDRKEEGWEKNKGRGGRGLPAGQGKSGRDVNPPPDSRGSPPVVPILARLFDVLLSFLIYTVSVCRSFTVRVSGNVARWVGNCGLRRPAVGRWTCRVEGRPKLERLDFTYKFRDTSSLLKFSENACTRSGCGEQLLLQGNWVQLGRFEPGLTNPQDRLVGVLFACACGGPRSSQSCLGLVSVSRAAMLGTERDGRWQGKEGQCSWRSTAWRVLAAAVAAASQPTLSAASGPCWTAPSFQYFQWESASQVCDVSFSVSKVHIFRV